MSNAVGGNQKQRSSQLDRRGAYSRGRSDGRPPSLVGANVDQTAYRDLAYTTDVGGKSERIDVYVPAGTPPPGGWPVILAIHGGGWRRMDKHDFGQRIASAFVPAGYVVAAPDYPLSAPGKPTWPMNLQDIQAALAWVRSQAHRFAIDPWRVVAMGESAGGNLAELLGYTSSATASGASSDSTSVSAVVSFSGPSDLSRLYSESRQASQAVVQFLGGTPSSEPGAYLAASPALRVKAGDPPTFLVLGSSDPVVPVSQSIVLASALQSAGVPHRLVILPGAGHDLNFPSGTPSNLVSQILEFLNATWKDNKSQSLIL